MENIICTGEVVRPRPISLARHAFTPQKPFKKFYMPSKRSNVPVAFKKSGRAPKRKPKIFFLVKGADYPFLNLF